MAVAGWTEPQTGRQRQSVAVAIAIAIAAVGAGGTERGVSGEAGNGVTVPWPFAR